MLPHCLLVKNKSTVVPSCSQYCCKHYCKQATVSWPELLTLSEPARVTKLDVNIQNNKIWHTWCWSHPAWFIVLMQFVSLMLQSTLEPYCQTTSPHSMVYIPMHTQCAAPVCTTCTNSPRMISNASIQPRKTSWSLITWGCAACTRCWATFTIFKQPPLNRQRCPLNALVSWLVWM